MIGYTAVALGAYLAFVAWAGWTVVGLCRAAARPHPTPEPVVVAADESTPIFDQLAAESASLDTLARWMAKDTDAEWAALDEAVNGRWSA